MKKFTKKAFTLVELLVVIAILAVLATVSVVGYNSFTKKATLSNDNGFIAQLNMYVAGLTADGSDIKTLSEVNEELTQFDFSDVKFNPTTKGYHYGFDIKNDKFVIIDNEYNLADSSSNKVDVFALVNGESDASTMMSKGYSLYLQNGTYSKTFLSTINKGVDVGDNTGIAEIAYSNTNQQEVVIRTNDESTIINVNAPSDTIKHYGTVGIVKITRTANQSYHEFGVANYVENASGRVVAEDGGLIKTCILTEQGTDATFVAVAQEDGGTIENCYATTNAVATGNNDENTKNVRLTVLSVSDNGNVLAQGKTTEEAKAIVESKIDEVAAKANNNNHSTISGVARIGSTGYETLQAAFDAVNEDGQVVVFLSDIEHNDVFIFSKAVTATVDLAGYTLKVTGDKDNNGGGRAIKITAGNVTVKNGNIDGRTYNGSTLSPSSATGISWSDKIIGGCIRINGGNVTLLNLKMYNNHGWGNAIKLESNNILTMRNCTVESVYGACVEVGYGVANIYDCLFSQSFTSTKSYISNCVSACYLGVANIYDTTMTETKDGELVGESTEGSAICPLWIYNSGGMINVYGGAYKTSSSNVITLNAADNKYFSGSTKEKYDNFVAANGASSVVNIYNGSFVGNFSIPSGTSLNIYGGSFSADVSQYRK